MVQKIKTPQGKELNPEKVLDAIRMKCLDCCGFCPAKDNRLTNESYNEAYQEVSKCEITDCTLHPFRLGKNPFHLSAEQKNAAAERMRKNKSEENE